MFSIQEIGHRINALRKQQNMTQMELADKLNISFQAVSSWERGNTMPDIAKLPELSALFGVGIDELLGSNSPILRAAAENDLENFLQTHKIDVQELSDAAPVLKPAQVDVLFENIDVETDKQLESLNALAPFLSTTLIDEIVEKHFSEENPMSNLLPFISSELCGKLAQKVYTHSGTKGLAKAKLLPFLPQKDLQSIAMQEFSSTGLDLIRYIAPFLDSVFLNDLARQALARDGIRAIIPIAPFLDHALLFEYIKEQYL